MSANNIVVIIKGPDGKFRGYHRDMDAWIEGQYNDGEPCPCLEIAGMLNFTRKGIPIADCQICHGSGQVCAPKEIPVFESDTIEGAIHAYDKWVEEMNNNENGFPFVVEYGYQFVGLVPSQETKETLEKSERGEDLDEFESVEKLIEDFEKDESSDGKQRIYTLILAGEGDTQEVFIGKGEEDLIAKVHTFYKKQVEDEEHQDQKHLSPGNIEFFKSQETSLCRMIEEYEDWSVGRHILKNIEPWWEEWTLFIADMPVKEEFVSLKQENEKLKNKLAKIDEALVESFENDDSYIIETLRANIAEKLSEKFEPWTGKD